MICLDCRDEIAAARIRALPRAVRCTACQGAAERVGGWDRIPIPVSALANAGLTAIAIDLPVSRDEFRQWNEFIKGEPT